jgi:altered-inheritance-of-mitochondria protein 5
MKEILKQKWNTELEVLTRKAYETRWEDVRDAATEGWKAAARVVKRE